MKKIPNRERPSWHRRAQRAYKVNRVLIILQIVAAFLLCGVIVFGIEKTIH